jgi:transcriptional regulator GlxA family with amidase domain
MPADRPAKRRDKRESHTNITLPKVRHVAIIAVPPARMLDVVGPAEVFADANKLHGGEPVYEIEIIAAAEDRAVPTQIGVPILAHRTYRELHGPVDTLLVAGGEWPRQTAFARLSGLAQRTEQKGQTFGFSLHWCSCSSRCRFAQRTASDYPLELVQ